LGEASRTPISSLLLEERDEGRLRLNIMSLNIKNKYKQHWLHRKLFKNTIKLPRDKSTGISEESINELS
jgi:hypothetical protein